MKEVCLKFPVLDTHSKATNHLHVYCHLAASSCCFLFLLRKNSFESFFFKSPRYDSICWTMKIYKSQGKQSRRSKDIRDQDSAALPISRIYYEMGLEAISAKLIYIWFCYSFACQFLSAKKKSNNKFFQTVLWSTISEDGKTCKLYFLKTWIFEDHWTIYRSFENRNYIIILLLMTD